jgi:type II secretory ATPase GspE/PulE/Tfp pilus assembly ATPase PilB-like protein
MSDLSNLPAQLRAAPPALPPVSDQHQAPRAAGSADTDPALQWPSASQDDPTQRLQGSLWPEVASATDCEIEGLNGHAMVGRLVAFDPERGVLQLRLAAARSPIALRFEHFRRLTLTQPVPLLPGPADAAPADVLLQRPPVPFRVDFKDHRRWEGLTHGHRDEACGLFLFEPLDTPGQVRRVFVPRAAFTQAEVGLRIGEALVAEKVLTPEQLKEALAEQQQLRQRKLGSILVVRQIITPEELHSAIAQQSRMPMVRIGEALTALGFINDTQLEEALAQQRADRSVPLGELLVKKGWVSRNDLQTALARKMGYPLVDVGAFPTEAEAIARLPYAVASRLPALPLLVRDGRLVVALEDPTNRRSIDELEFGAQCRVVPVLARVGVLQAAVERAYRRLGAALQATRGSEGSGQPEFEHSTAGQLLATMERVDLKSLRDGDDDQVIEQSDNSLVRLINSMIEEAHGQGVSDIHIECRAGREKVQIRFRKDGQLCPYLELPHTYRSAVIGRLKIMCDLDISERRKPQDGKINFGKFMQGSKLELRVVTIPTHSNCEDAVVRLLTAGKPIPLNDLGLSPRNLERFQRAMQRPCGLLLCVGPTGSGKTTTLHSALSFINTPERKIWTAEDPIEITQDGLRQVQVNPKIDWTFAKALRSFLRADPDVIMVGEIRDQETAQVAIESSLTGHLVLSTLHTNSAPETVTRLLDMGMDPFNFADALLGVLAQRLVRRLCTHCRLPYEASPEEEEELLQDYLHALDGVDEAPAAQEVLDDWRARFGSGAAGGTAGGERLIKYKPVGCRHCNGSGWRGRVAIHELMMVSRSLRHLIQTGARAQQLLRQAMAEGMRTLRQDGIEKVLAGVTTIEEVRASS